ncbi:gamma-tubulin complex component 4 [Metopolophium dirhodum]|uniref:gamma-tubulin complex component 4 n=1 Tax=Metopolophium dirhodum TaxID=44670 RepID=UPI0029902438|nr:gamma-tubulin complex component 4 [Metopolophium dirhodum]
MECLIPDILFTLLGHKSEILQCIVDNDSNFTDDEYIILNTEDKRLLKCFLNLAEEYQKLNTVIVSFNRLQSIYIESESNRQGLYFEAFVNGMLTALKPYRDCINDIENNLSNNKENKCLLTETLRKVEQHKPLIVAVNNILDQIELSQLHGGQILNLTYEVVCMEFLDNKVQLSLIFNQCLQVLISQLNTFFAHGVIFDPHNEFFIESKYSKNSKKFKQFSLLPSLMPSFVPLSTASKITRIGDVIKSLQYSNDQSSLINYKDISIQLYGHKKDELFSDLLNLVNVSLFTKNEFVKVIDKFYNVVDEYMLKASFNNDSFSYHMKLVRDFYLLGNGEFYKHFLNKMCSLSLKSEHSLRAVKVAFINTAQDIKMHKSVNQVFGFSSLEDEEADETTWTKIKVTFETKWPLQFIFTSSVQKNYSKLFAFLSRIKRVQTNLHNIWIEKKSKSYEINAHNVQLKTKLSFLIDTLYSYLQMDVIEDEYFLLLEKLTNANDFQTIKHIHDIFQTNIMRDSFLFMEEVYLGFNRILDMCENYCRYMTDITAALNPQYKQCFEELNLLFTKKPNKLVTLINIIREIHVTPKPNQFIVRLNYNNWFLQAISSDS